MLSLLETAHPFLVTDRIDGGGIWTGERTLVGGQGTSARQVTFRLDGHDVTDPGGAGISLFYSDLSALQSVVVQSASLDAEVAGPGPIVNMTLPRPGRTWSGTAQFALSPESMQSEGGAIAPIARLVSLTDGGVSAGGPLADARAALFASARSTSAERIERADDVAARELGARVHRPHHRPRGIERRRPVAGVVLRRDAARWPRVHDSRIATSTRASSPWRFTRDGIGAATVTRGR